MLSEDVKMVWGALVIAAAITTHIHITGSGSEQLGQTVLS